MARDKIKAPIDRPLSRAYLREFTGWSSAYPPGISDPTSLRIMENVMIQRDGSARVRPGLRYLSIESGAVPISNEVVGTHEPFYLNDGTKAYLFAVREDDDTIGFRVFANTGLGYVVQSLTATGIDFDVPQGDSVLRFTAATSYVKYLQIDNKIFALSNAGETMRLFEVGNTKRAKKLNAIERPAWSASDKLTVVHPTQAWIDSGVPIATRTSFLDNPSFETNVLWWTPGSSTSFERTTDQAQVGGVASAKMGSQPALTNYMPTPLTEPVADLGGWHAGAGQEAAGMVFDIVGDRMRATIPAVKSDHIWYVDSPLCTNVPRQPAGHAVPPIYWLKFDLHENLTAADSHYRLGVLFRWFASNGALVLELSSNLSVTGDRATAYLGTVPSGAASLQVYPYVSQASESGPLPGGYFEISNVQVGRDGEVSTHFDGDNGADYYWTGAADASASVYHPAQEVRATGTHMPVSAGLTYTGSAYLRAATDPRDFRLDIEWYEGHGALLSTETGAVTADVNTGWTRLTVTGVAPAGATEAKLVVVSDAPVERDEYHYLDSVQFEEAAAADVYFDGSFPDTSTEQYSWSSGVPHNGDSTVVEYSAPPTVPTPATPTVDTLIGSGTNTYNFGFFYTFANEVGESAASQVTVVKAQRGWSQWKWETANVSAEPSGTSTSDPAVCADQLVAYMPSAVFQNAIDQGAIRWNLYMMTWSDQDPVPVAAVQIASREIPAGAAHGSYGWLRMTPQQADANSETAPLPNEATRFNYSTPSSGGQGIVAADRMVMVYDPAAAAVIRWSSNQQGHYTDFSAVRGGGFKTLTSGNLFVPAVVKLWQNPQSVDTLTILCLGVDGYSTGYYMAPSQVASQSEATNIMGFEETTATPGTTSPYGCEVLNNALYHPLDEYLMKSTATNYNINHSTLTDQIQNIWRRLVAKDKIVSSQLDNRLYYLVHNPDGDPLEEGCWGNEVWVLDAAKKEGTWSRWLVQGQSLRKFEQGSRIVMSLVRPDGIYYFDDEYSSDDYVGMLGGNLLTDNQASAETDDSDWTPDTIFGFFPQLPTITSSAVRAFDGTKSVLFTWPAPTGGDDDSFGRIVTPTEVGRTYTASCYVYVPTGSPDVRLRAPYQFVTWSETTSVKDQWVRLTMTFVAENDEVYFGLERVAPHTAGECYVDGVMLIEGTEDDLGAFTTEDATVGLASRSIPWRLETNTQGANRAHDAWAHLQQANVVVGNFQGTMEYGVRGHDINGRTVEIRKLLRDSNAPSSDGTMFDLEDYLLIQRDLKEWFFFAGSATDEVGATLASSGQINLVQYRYTPVTVNTGYEFGSVETFEYGRAGNSVDARTTDNGVPMPHLDTGRP